MPLRGTCLTVVALIGAAPVSEWLAYRTKSPVTPLVWGGVRTVSYGYLRVDGCQIAQTYPVRGGNLTAGPDADRLPVGCFSVMEHSNDGAGELVVDEHAVLSFGDAVLVTWPFERTRREGRFPWRTRRE